MFTAALFNNSQNPETTEIPLTDEWKHKRGISI
jgi:hypothetical protein